MRRAAAVIVRSGLSTRPAISQPRPTDATAMMPSATPNSMSSWSRVSLRSLAAVCWTSSGQVPVEHDHVVVGDQRALEAGRPVEGDVHGHLLLPQPDADRLGQLPVCGLASGAGALI